MEKKLFDKYQGRDSYLYEIGNNKLRVGIIDFGCRVHFLKYRDVDVCLGYNTIQDYLDSGTYMGATIGRVCNRIEDGKFTLNGVDYQLNLNDGKNHLHGGIEGFDRKFFEVVKWSKNELLMHYVSPDNEEMYPGELDLYVKYTVSGSDLKIEFKAKSDKDTIWCPTNHLHFNLDGEGTGNCLNNMLKINSTGYTPIDTTLIPLGFIKKVYNTPFDFSSKHEIGLYFNSQELLSTKGYDHNFILDSKNACTVYSKKTKIEMNVKTDLEALQLYTGGYMTQIQGKTSLYRENFGFCLEPQFVPNAINMDGFSKPILKQNKVKKHYIIYHFSKSIN